jgi:hypothetical protein
MGRFFYIRLNEIQRLIGSEKHEHMGRARLSTLVTFVVLLHIDKYDEKPFE